MGRLILAIFANVIRAIVGKAGLAQHKGNQRVTVGLEKWLDQLTGSTR